MKDRDSSAHSTGHGIVSISGSCPKSTAATYCAFRGQRFRRTGCVSFGVGTRMCWG